MTTTASRQFGSNPSTPTKPRTGKSGNYQSPSMAGGFEGSPTSTLSPGSGTTGTTSQHGDVPQTSYRSLFAAASAATTPAESQRQLFVRADPALLTCFDPADKELYELWAPKR